MKLRQRLLPLLVGFAVVAALTLAVATKPRPTDAIHSKSNTALPGSKSSLDVASSDSEGNEATSAATRRLSPVEKFVRQESQKVGRADPDPDESFRRLKRVAVNLRRFDIETLKATALNQDLGNDQRFLSVYLLALNGSTQVLPALLGVALEPLSIQDVSSRLYAEELMIRTQALEGLAKIDGSRQKGGALEQFLRRQDNSFLADQAQRLISARN